MRIEQKEKTKDVRLSFETEFKNAPHFMKTEMCVVAHIDAPEQEETKDEKERAPIDLVAVVDRSGSMSGSKFQLTKQTLKFIISQLNDRDRLGLVSYADEAKVEFGLTNLTSEGKAAALKICDGMTSGGCTNLSGGLQHALTLMKQRLVTKDVSSVLLFTDGLANRGIINVNQIVNIIKGKNIVQSHVRPIYRPPPQRMYNQRPPQMLNQNIMTRQQYQQQVPPMMKNSRRTRGPKQHRPQHVLHAPQPQQSGIDYTETCTVNTFGFGSDHDANFMKKLSDAGNGLYYYIDNPEVIAEAFINCLGGLMSTVAKKLVLRIESISGIEIRDIHTKYQLITKKKGNLYEIMMHDLQSEEERDILLTIGIPKIDEPKKDFPLLKLTLEYHNMLLKEDQIKNVIGFIGRPETVSKEDVNPKVDLQRNRMRTVKAMEKAVELGNQKRFDEARKIIDSAAFEIKNSKTNEDEYSNNMVSDLMACNVGLQSENYSRMGAQRLNNIMGGHGKQRATSMKAPSQARYRNRKRSGLMKKFKGS